MKLNLDCNEIKSNTVNCKNIVKTWKNDRGRYKINIYKRLLNQEDIIQCT